MASGDTALDRAKRLQSALCRLVERRERTIEKASGEFRLDMLAAVEAVDDETLALVLRALAMDRDKPYLQLALQLAIDERNERNRQPNTQRSGGDPPGPSDFLTTDEAARALAATPPRVVSTPEQARVLYGEGSAAESFLLTRGRYVDPEGVEHDADAGEFRYPEPGEPAVELPDGTVIAAP